MSAWQYSKRGRLSTTIELVTVAAPLPGAGDVVIDVEAVGLNPVEEQLAQSPDWLLKWMGAPTVGSKPMVPCMDFAGVISAVGSDVAGYQVGDQVYGMRVAADGNGALQQHLCIPASSPFVVKPASLDGVQAAALPLVYMTVYDALVEWGRLPFSPAPETPARSVFINGGSSGTGSVAIQLARKMGLAVVTSCSTRNVDLVKQLGADEVIDYTKQHVPTEALMSAHAPYAVVLDCVGGTALLGDLEHLVLHDPGAPELGIYVTIVGDKTGRDSMGGAITNYYYPSQALRTLRGKLNDVPYLPFKSLLANRRYACIMLVPTKEKLETAAELVAARGPPPIDSVFPFTAFAKLESGRARGKVVVKM